MLYRLLCLIFHTVDLVLSAVEVVRATVASSCKKLTGGVVSAE